MFSQQCLIMDADDTLWESNTHYERAIEDFIDLLDHTALERGDIRAVLDDVERANTQIHGYGARSFVRSLHDCWERLHRRGASDDEAVALVAMGERILAHVIELLPGVRETLEVLQSRHRLVVLTKGEVEEQRLKVERSGIAAFFEEYVVVPEKTVAAYVDVVARLQADPAKTWMIGNSPRSDVNPAVAAGLRAVFIPHPHTWVLEQEPLAVTDGRVLQLRAFTELLAHF